MRLPRGRAGQKTRIRSRGAQPAIAATERSVAAVLQHVAVRDDHAIEVPGEDALEALRAPRRDRGSARDRASRGRSGRSSAAAASASASARRPRAEVEGEVAEDERAAGAVEEDDLVLVGAPAEEDLIAPRPATPRAPRRRAWRRTPDRDACARAPAPPRGAPPDTPRRRRRRRGDARDWGRRRSERGRARRARVRSPGVERDRRVQQQAAVGEAHHGHARADLEPVEALTSLRDPEVGGEGAQRWRRGCRHGEARFCRVPRPRSKLARVHFRLTARLSAR